MRVTPGIKNYPEPPTANQTNGCLGTTPGSPVATYVAGTNITVTWLTTILHTSAPGVSIAVQYSATDGFNNNILASGVNIGNVGFNSLNVVLPSKTCNPCVIQWIWASASDGGFYMGCSDIVIIANGGLAVPPSGCNTTYYTVPPLVTSSPTLTTSGSSSFIISVAVLLFAIFMVELQ